MTTMQHLLDKRTLRMDTPLPVRSCGLPCPALAPAERLLSSPIRTEQYGSDQLSRLTTVNYGDGDTKGYTFDPLGNRLTKVHNGVSEGYTVRVLPFRSLV